MTSAISTNDDLSGFLLTRGYVAVPLTVNAVGHFELAAAPVDGAIGGDILRATEAIIDYARATVYLRVSA